MPNFVTGLCCVFCGSQFTIRVGNTCPRCGITGILDVQYDYPAIAKVLTRKKLATRADHSHWRYRELLPIADNARLPSLAVGWTPTIAAEKLARHLGVRELLIKDDGRNPTASLKDRASSLGVVKAVEKRRKIIACASTGNAASSLAGMAASMGLRSAIFVPLRAPEAKVTQLLVFGATVLRVGGSYEQAYELCQQSCERWGWYNRNCAINPYLIEGKKTVGLEIAEQLEWKAPDWIAMSVGDGCTIAGAWKAFQELKTLGLISRMPRMLGVQALGAAPVTKAFRIRRQMEPMEPNTIADSIAVGVPRNWKKAVMAIEESGGAMINVADDEILDAIQYTGRLTGVFAEPAAATAVAGLKRAVSEEVVPRSCRALAVVTGSGLKDVRAARKAVANPFEVPPDGSGLEEILARQGLIPAAKSATNS